MKSLKEMAKAQTEVFSKVVINQAERPAQTLAKLVKPLKAPLWTKEMSVETYALQIENWAKSQE